MAAFGVVLHTHTVLPPWRTMIVMKGFLFVKLCLLAGKADVRHLRVPVCHLRVSFS